MNNQKPSNRMHYVLPRMALACRGNTLAPVVIALFISALASIAFLQQGAQLSEKQKQIQAPEEVLDIIEEFVQLNNSKDYANIVASDLTFPGTSNVYNHTITFYPASTSGRLAAYVKYHADNKANCENLKTIIEKYKLMITLSCGHRIYSCYGADLCIMFNRGYL